MTEVAPVPQARRKYWRWTRNVVLIVLVVGFAAWKLMPANVVRTPMLLERDGDATLHEQPPRPSKNVFNFGAHAGALKSQNNTTSGSIESHSSPAYLPDRSLVIFNESKHLLLERVGTELLEKLKTDNRFERIEYYPSGYTPKPGAEAADLVIRLNADSIVETGIATQDLKATVTASLGTSYAASNHHVHDHLSAPVVDHDSRISIEHQSSLTGFESSSARYVLQGKDIAAQFAKSIDDRLKSLREKFSPVPKMPASLRPEFQATPEFEFVKRLNANCQSSSHGLMFCNETFWQFESSGEIESQVGKVRDELNEAGWKLNQIDAAQPFQAYLRAEKGCEIVELFPLHRDNLGTPALEKAVPIPYAIRYTHRMDSEELEAALREVLSGSTPDVESLLMLRRYGNAEQRQQIIKQIEQNPTRSVEAWLAVAEAHGNSDDIDACRRALIRAKFLLRTLVNTSDYDQRIKNLANQRKIPESELKQVDRETLKELGIIELDAASGLVEIEVSTNLVASFSLADAPEDNPIITVRIGSVGNQQSNRPVTMTILEATDNMRSWSSQSISGPARMQHQCSVGGKSVFITIERLKNDSFGISAKVGAGP